MHIACSIYRLQNENKSVKNGQTKHIILKNKRLYNDLKEILHLIEEEFYVEFNDDELANIIQIIRQIWVYEKWVFQKIKKIWVKTNWAA